MRIYLHEVIRIRLDETKAVNAGTPEEFFSNTLNITFDGREELTLALFADTQELLEIQKETSSTPVTEKTNVRTAIVRNAILETVQDYLPSNYEAREIRRPHREAYIEITGEDDHGWTLDKYVIPRLASGLIVATEVAQKEASDVK